MKKHLIIILSILTSLVSNAAVERSLTKMGTYGYIDGDNWIVYPLYSKVSSFNHDYGIGMITIDGTKWAIVDKDGVMRTGYNFPAEVRWYGNGLGICNVGSKEYRIVNMKGETILSKTVPMEIVGDKIAIKYEPSYYNLVDYDLKSASIDRYKAFYHNTFTVDNKVYPYMVAHLATRGYKFIDALGKDISHVDEWAFIPYYTYLSNANYKMMSDNKWDAYGKYVIAVNHYGKWGVATMDGKAIVPFRYKSKQELYKNLDKLFSGELKTYFRNSAKNDMDAFLARLEAADREVNSSLAKRFPKNPVNVSQLPLTHRKQGNVNYKIITGKDGNKYLHDTYGFRFIEQGYRNIEEMGRNPEGFPYFRVMKAGKKGLMNLDGDYIIAPEYDDVGALYTSDKFMLSKKGGKSYLHSSATGSLITPDGYDRIDLSLAKGGKIPVVKDGVRREIYENGSEVPLPKPKPAAPAKTTASTTAPTSNNGHNHNHTHSSGNSGQSSGVTVTERKESLPFGGYVIIQEASNGRVVRTTYGYCPSCHGRVVCASCYGSGLCSICHGRGGTVSAAYGNFYPCHLCGTTGRCSLCGGTGKCICNKSETPGYIAISQMITQNGQVLASVSFTTGLSDSGSSSSSSSSSSRRSSSGKQVCPDCGGTKMWKRGTQPEYGRPRAGLEKYFHDGHSFCPYCNTAEKHWHSKCITCMHISGTENPYR